MRRLEIMQLLHYLRDIPLSKQIFKEVVKICDRAVEFEDAGDYGKTIELYESAWAMIPDPKLKHDYSVMLLGDICMTCLGAGDLDKAKTWHSMLMKAPYTNLHTHQFELGAIVYFRLGEFDIAMDYLRLFVMKGRRLSDLDSDVKKFYADQMKRITLPPDLQKQITAIVKRSQKLIEKGDTQEALEVLDDGLKLLPKPKDKWELTVWLCVMKGKALSQIGEYAMALSSFQSAQLTPAGRVNPFVFIRIGETKLQMGDKQGAKEEFLKAYMIDEDQAFSDESPAVIKIMQEAIEKID